MPRRRNEGTEESCPPKRSRYNFRNTRSRRLRAKRLGADPQGRKPVLPSEEEYRKKNKILNVEEKPGKALKCQSVDLHLRDNRTLHHTSVYEQQDLILRRGDKFKLSITFDRKVDSNHDVIILQFAFGSLPSESKSTLIRIPIATKSGVQSKGKDWVSVTDQVKNAVVTCFVTPPADAKIGRYELFVESSLKGDAESVKRYKYKEDCDIIVIFNAWHKDDVVYMEDDRGRKEYVMNENGRIWYGSAKRNAGRPWAFGQFEEPCLDACLFLLDRGELGDSARNSAVSVIRKVSALTNSMDDEGVLFGRWTSPYPAKTTKPWEWTGSVDILKQFMQTDEPVKYGQCWVFSGLVTTLLRAVGIPTRSVTNFESAHDSDMSMTIDKHYYENEEDEDEDKYIDDSVWNFHVWNESWLRRPDLPEGYDGWQAHDATPQEASDDVMRCGPASLKAIKEGHVYLPFDTGFIYSEVNGDRIKWLVKEDGTTEPLALDPFSVGKCISTKAIGGPFRHDLTNDYKHPDGSAAERKVAKMVDRFRNKTLEVVYGKMEEKNVDLKVEVPLNTMIGDDIKIKIVLTNKVKQDFLVRVRMTLSSLFYTGVRGKRVLSRTEEVNIKGKEVKTVPLSVSKEEYEQCRNPDGGFYFLCQARNLQTGQLSISNEKFSLVGPEFSLKAPEPVPYGENTKYVVSFKNTTNVKLTNAFFKMDTNNQLTDEVVTHKLRMYRYGNNTYAAEVGNKGDKKDPDHQCDTCGRRFFTTEQLSRHVRNLHGPTLHCPRPNCGYTCPKTRAYRMREHIHKQHEIPEMESQSQARGTSTAKDKTKTKSKSRSKSEPRTTISSVVAPATPIPTVETLDDWDPIDMSVAGNLDQPAHTWNSPGFTISGLAHGLDFSPTLLGSLPDELLFMDAPMPEVTPGQVRCTSPSLQQQPRPSGAAVTKLNGVSVGNQAVQESETKATQVGPDHVTQATQTHVPGTSSKQQQTDPEKLHYLANHPAYFFMGAPSVYMQGSTAELLRGTRQEALQQQNRYRRRWVPHGYICITKKESVTMPDGRIYSLEDTWVRQPVCARLTSTATQTDERKRRMEPEDDQPLDLSKKARVEEKPIKPGEVVKDTFTLHPHKRYKRKVKMIVTFSSDEIVDLTQECKVRVVNPPESASDDSGDESDEDME